jgi:acyl-CoA thioester hydrolase
MPPTDKTIATTEFYVRYAETDAMGIVHHASYIVWLEEARSHFARTLGGDYADFERAGYGLSVIEVHIQYRAPSRYGDRVAVHCWVEDVKSRAMSFGYEVTLVPGGALCASATTRHMCITRDGKPAKIPDEWRRRWGLDAAD